MRSYTLMMSLLALLLAGCIQGLLDEGDGLVSITATEVASSTSSTGEPPTPTTSGGSGVQTVTGDEESTGPSSAGSGPGSSSGEAANLPASTRLTADEIRDEYLATKDRNGQLRFAYWATGSQGDQVEVIGELGGKDVFIVCADANLERAAEAAVYGSMGNCGQACVSVERAMVVDSVHDRFIELVKRKLEKIKVGGPDENADMGPMTFAKQLQTVERHVESPPHQFEHLAKRGGRGRRSGHAAGERRVEVMVCADEAGGDRTHQASTGSAGVAVGVRVGGKPMGSVVRHSPSIWW